MTIIHRFKHVSTDLGYNSSYLFDPLAVNLTAANPRDVVCYMTFGTPRPQYDPREAARISAIFVILILATCATMFPVLATRSERYRIPRYAYLLARYFGSGVIIATAFIHLLDPAYAEIGPQTCVGMTGAWANYSWPPAIAMTSAMCVFLLDFTVECHVQAKYGLENVDVHGDVEGTITRGPGDEHHPRSHSKHGDGEAQVQVSPPPSSSSLLPAVQDEETLDIEAVTVVPPSPSCDSLVPVTSNTVMVTTGHTNTTSTSTTLVVVDDKQQATADRAVERDFEKQIAAFLVLEFGVIFHSIIIGLNLGVAGSEFKTLYPVLSFHQAFEGLGIGARLSAIPFPHRLRYAPWLLCLAFGMTTPIAIAVGVSLRSSYAPQSFTANVVSGILDSTSAGILLYTGFVEFLARDFLFHPERSGDMKRVSFMICCLYLGIATMALLGKWA